MINFIRRFRIGVIVETFGFAFDSRVRVNRDFDLHAEQTFRSLLVRDVKIGFFFENSSVRKDRNSFRDLRIHKIYIRPLVYIGYIFSE